MELTLIANLLDSKYSQIHINNFYTQAKNLIELAAGSGADCVKLQTYKAGNLARIDSPAYWDTNEETSSTQFELFSKYDGLGY